MKTSVRAQLHSLERRILKEPARWMFGPWVDSVTDEAGVYVVWDDRSGTPIYVGQTSSLRERMDDLRHWENHTFRRKAADLLGVPRGDEEALSAAMAERYRISYIEVSFGRLELEDYLKLRWRETLLNGPANRMWLGANWRWVRTTTPRCKRAGRRLSRQVLRARLRRR